MLSRVGTWVSPSKNTEDSFLIRDRRKVNSSGRLGSFISMFCLSTTGNHRENRMAKKVVINLGSPKGSQEIGS